MTNCNVKNNIKNIIIKMKSIAQVSKDNELAQVMDVEKATLSSWKNKRKEIPLQYLVDFCDEYSISLDWLIRDTLAENKIKSDEIKMPYYVDYNFSKKSGYITTKKDTLIDRGDKKYDNVRAIKTISNEMPITAPKNSIMFLDFDDDKVSETPAVFLIMANNNYFIRELSITPQLDYFISTENKNIQSMRIQYNEIEVLAKLIGVTKWQN